MRSIAALFAAIFVIGCQSEPVSTPEADKPKETVGTPDVPAVTAPTIPDSLKHDGYAYAGLSNPGKQDYIVKITGQPDAESASTVTFKEMKDGGALFDRSRDGALAAVGSDVVRVDEKGVTVVSVSIGTLLAPALELPAKMDVGVTWKSDSTIKTADGNISSTGTYKVVGDEKVKVGGAEHMARKVTFTGKNSSVKGQGAISGTYWFVKDKGAVKTEMTQTVPGQAAQTFVLELK